MNGIEKQKRKGRMLKGISRRWFVNTIGIVLVILVVFIVALSLTVQSYTYSSIQQVLRGHATALLNVSAGSGGFKTASEFTAATRDRIENLTEKNTMEVMAINRSGNVIVTSTGFAPDPNQVMPDYLEALSSPDNYGDWIGELDTGERVMAITRVVRDSEGNILGSLRYLVSMEQADEKIVVIVLALIVIGVFIMLFIVLSGFYFIRSIIIPIRQVTESARLISHGNFDVRIEKEKEDEIGQLCDSINDMAGELGAAERMKNDFISSVSHELRTPLTSIKGWAETLLAGVDQETEDKGMKVIIRESERLSGIVEELLDFSQLQNSRIQLNMSKLDLLAELDEAVYMFTDRAQTEQKELHYQENVSLPPIWGDVNRLRQVFVNIIDNALKYTHAGGSITIAAAEANGYIKITIADTGCGIPEEHLLNVKKKFYKANQLVRGSGIGLAVADEIVALHCGTLEVDSAEGTGTTVTVSLPTVSLLEKHPELAVTDEMKTLLDKNSI